MGNKESTTKIDVSVEKDHLRRLAGSLPTTALSELIWNSVDADADNVTVVANANDLGGIEEVRVKDDGHGFSPSEARRLFAGLGGSAKKSRVYSPSHRILHGANGEGRFKAFALGERVEWLVRYTEPDGKVYRFTVTGHYNTIDRFHLTSAQESEEPTGVEVRITNAQEGLPSLGNPSIVEPLTERFALYMLRYPSISILIDGVALDPRRAIFRKQDISVGTEDAELTIVEWAKTTRRSLNLCDQHGFTLREMQPGIRAPRFHFTAYLCARAFPPLFETGELEMETLHPTVRALVDEAKKEMKRYFARRAAEDAQARVEEWKKEELYPYEKEPKSPVEEAERQVFDVCALQVEAYTPDFDRSDAKSKRLTFRLLRRAIESGPQDAQKILTEVLELPDAKRKELAKLLERTTLSAMINVSKTIADRIEFLRGLELILFEEQIKKVLLERSQLHRILADNTWLFGEEFHLTADDEGLTTVLNRHLNLLDEDHAPVNAPVKTSDGSAGVVDLMLSRVVPQPNATHRHHLVVELKRPKQRIDAGVLSQVEKYAVAVANDERFKNTRTKWTFWAVSNDMDDIARRRTNQRNRAEGIAHEDEDFTIWAMTWSQIIQQCQGRLRSLQETLEYTASEPSAKQYLREVYSKYLPTEATDEGSDERSPESEDAAADSKADDAK